MGCLVLSSDWVKTNVHKSKFETAPNYQCYGHNYDIVCSNDLILCQSVRPGMTNNIVEGSFHFLCMKKSFFIF
jgi:hypothetical protein